VLAGGLTVGTAAYLTVVYPSLPFGLPVRYVRGIPLIYQVKTPAMVFLPVIVQTVLLTTFAAISLVLLWRARTGESGEHRELDHDRMRLAVEGIALVGVVWIAVQAIGAVRLIQMWQRGSGGFGSVYSAVMITAIVASIVIAARTMKLIGHERRQSVTVDPSLWRLRLLYFNPGDPALFVGTRSGVGWTLNFGRPLAIAILGGILTLGIGGPYLLARWILRGLGD